MIGAIVDRKAVEDWLEWVLEVAIRVVEARVVRDTEVAGDCGVAEVVVLVASVARVPPTAVEGRGADVGSG